MANMFSGNTEKKIPKSLKQCYETDAVTHNLWIWCERLEKWGFRIFLALLIFGIVAIISAAIENAQLLNELGINSKSVHETYSTYGIEFKSVFDVAVETAFQWAFYCFLEYCTYHMLALLVGSLATIVQHTKITANIALYTAATTENFAEKPTATSTHAVSTENVSHKCECGERFYGDICPSCGRKAVTKTASAQKQAEWLCPNCETRNAIASTVCKGCGKTQPQTITSTRTIKTSTAPQQNSSHKCVCGERFYGDTCPMCGRNAQ